MQCIILPMINSQQSAHHAIVCNLLGLRSGFSDDTAGNVSAVDFLDSMASVSFAVSAVSGNRLCHSSIIQ